MTAGLNDKFRKVGASTVTTLAAPGKALAASSINVGSTTNYPTDTGIVIAIRQVDTDGELVSGTYTEWNATVTSATSLSLETTPRVGSDQVYPAGSTTQVFIVVSAAAQNDLIDGILTTHDQDGSLKDGAVDAAAVLANNVVTTAKILDSNVTTAKIADGAVTAAKTSGIWWEELARATASTTVASLTTSTFTAKKYLKIITVWLPTGGSCAANTRFNSDPGSNYNFRYSASGAADVSSTSQTSFAGGSTTVDTIGWSVKDVVNISNKEKMIYDSQTVSGTAGAANAVVRYEISGKWANTSAQITEVTIVASSNNFAAGTEVIVLGHN